MSASSDLILAAIGQLLLAAIAAAIAIAIGVQRKGGKKASVVLAAIAGTSAIAYALFVRGKPWLADVLPTSAVIVWSDLTLPLATTAGVGLWPILPKPTARRVFLVLAITFAGAAVTFDPLRRLAVGSPPTTDVWDGEICIQTTPATCGPAALATLLRAHEIDFDEAILARFCLTNSDGSPDLGLWRGLSLATADTEWEPIRLTGEPAGFDRPAVITVGLPSNPPPGVNPQYANQWGWQPGVRHVVVLYGTLPGDGYDIGDPAAGRERWDEDAVHVLYRGTAFALRRRK